MGLPHTVVMAKKHSGWYPVSTIGMAITVLYASVPPYIVYAQTTDTFPDSLKMPILVAMGFVLLCMIICKYTDKKPFHRKR